MQPFTEVYDVESLLKGMDYMSSLKHLELAEMVTAIGSLVIASANLDYRSGMIDKQRHAAIVQRAKDLTPTHIMQ